MVRCWLLLLLILLPLESAGEETAGGHPFPSAEAAEASFSVPAEHVFGAAPRLAERGGSTESAPRSRQIGPAGCAPGGTISFRAAPSLAARFDQASPLRARQQHVLPWSTAPPALA